MDALQSKLEGILQKPHRSLDKLDPSLHSASRSTLHESWCFDVLFAWTDGLAQLRLLVQLVAESVLTLCATCT